MWPEQLVANVADDPLADVGHQVGREVRAEALGEVGDDDQRRPERNGSQSAPGRTLLMIGLIR